MGFLSSGVTRALLGVTHFITWASSAIVVGITAYFLNDFPHDQHLIFEIVISALVLGFWMPSFVVPFIGTYKFYYLPLNFVFSYLWLTAFIFSAQDYNESSCAANAPTGGSCSLKLTLEAFLFLGFIFTVFSTIIDIVAWRTAAKADAASSPEKSTRPSGEQAA
ncbi:hypothetical protein BS50DRAFT_636708 [Corynespora cassiicola Philippines]|uniref:MARVEL domain-containing protein n=1 Tax=Corynespora cassiicola Philippines TaxID=1448308 RepID=A0A2T2NGQ1_CORCC|nr:hypothetical protein BS50DRAFT_636708 [Corynespora cassiicola Philippines]